MKVEKQILYTLLDSSTSYLIPLFQRGYVWTEINWETLWDDLVRNAEDRRSGRDVQHFIGALVLQQMETMAGHMPQMQVIDGQQRLTTVQLILKALHNFVSTYSPESAVLGDIRKYLFNTGGKVKTESDTYKVWPTNADREAFVRTMRLEPHQTIPDSRFGKAYRFFLDQFTAWFAETESQYATSDDAAVALLDVIERGFVLAAISLEGNDDSQEIFETLNALGTPLGPADLIKNHLFRIAQTLEMDLEGLYETFWKPIDADSGFWQQQMTVGRFTRNRIDVFFQYWIAVQLERDVSADIVFRSFRDFMTGADAAKVQATFESITRFAAVYRMFTKKQGTPQENEFAARLDEMETYAVYPLILFFYDRVSDQEERHAALRIVESYLVRRMLLLWNSRSYSRSGTDTIHSMVQAGEVSAEALRLRLMTYDAAGTQWPTDEQMRTELSGKALYGNIRQNRLHMVLLAINAAMHQERSEIVSISGNLQIEHIMPKAWRSHWSLPTDAPPNAAALRDRIINTLGNLTVITGKLNSSVSNGTWQTKRAGLSTFSNLVINRELLEIEEWNEQTIAERTERLTDYICRMWPR